MRKIGLGALAAGRAPVGVVTWAALVLFCVVLAASLAIVVPSRGMAFTHHPHDLLATTLGSEAPQPLSDFRRTLAFHNGIHYQRNARQLRRLGAVLTGGSMCLGIEVILWLVSFVAS